MTRRAWERPKLEESVVDVDLPGDERGRGET